MRCSPILVSAAVKQNGLALQFASRKWKNNYKIVFSAVSQNGEALKYASKGWKNNYAVVQAAVGSNPVSFEYVSQRLVDDYDLALSAVSRCGEMLEHASARLRNVIEIATSAVGQAHRAFRFVSTQLKEDVGVARICVRRADDIEKGVPLVHVGDKQKIKNTFVDFLVDQIPNKLWDNEEFVVECLEKFPGVVECLFLEEKPEAVIKALNCKDLVEKALPRCPSLIKQVSPSLRDNWTIVKIALCQSWLSKV